MFIKEDHYTVASTSLRLHKVIKSKIYCLKRGLKGHQLEIIRRTQDSFNILETLKTYDNVCR